MSYIAYKRQVHQKYSGSYFHFHYNSIIRITECYLILKIFISLAIGKKQNRIV